MIFISYARADAAAAQRLATELAEAGLPSLKDPPLPQGDVFWRDRLAAQMAPCSVMAALDSPAAEASPWVVQERGGFGGAGGVVHGDARGSADLVAALRRAWQRQAAAPAMPAATSDPVIDTAADRLARSRRDDELLAHWQGLCTPMTATKTATARDGDRAWLADGAIELRAVPAAEPGWYLALAPLTNALYRRFLDASGRPAPATWQRTAYAAPELPVTGITWHDAAACAAWYGAELPPEAVWAAAARAGGTGGEFATVDGGLCARRAHHGQPFAAGAPCTSDAYLATPAGFQGLCGNTWDWCADAWDDGSALPKRVIRGGGWMDGAAFCRITARYRNAAIDPDACVGLRLAWRPAAGSR